MGVKRGDVCMWGVYIEKKEEKKETNKRRMTNVERTCAHTHKHTHSQRPKANPLCYGRTALRGAPLPSLTPSRKEMGGGPESGRGGRRRGGGVVLLGRGKVACRNKWTTARRCNAHPPIIRAPRLRTTRGVKGGVGINGRASCHSDKTAERLRPPKKQRTKKGFWLLVCVCACVRACVLCVRACVRACDVYVCIYMYSVWCNGIL